MPKTTLFEISINNLNTSSIGNSKILWPSDIGNFKTFLCKGIGNFKDFKAQWYQKFQRSSCPMVSEISKTFLSKGIGNFKDLI